MKIPFPPRLPGGRSSFRSALGTGTLALTLVATATPLAAQSTPRLLGKLTAPPELTYLKRAAGLVIPVEGVTLQALRDSYRQGRSGGREHKAIDIHAPEGTPVLAAADGKILKLHSGSKGGLSIYHLDPDGRTRYYYAHLQRYAEGIVEGKAVRKGEVIGYVGDTGNAKPGDYHLHFAVALLTDVRRWWEGENLNPYALLQGEDLTH